MNELYELRQHSYRLYLTFLKEHVKSNNLIPTHQEEDCVKAFCVLSHAAIEDYVEKLTLRTIAGAHKRFGDAVFVDNFITTQDELDLRNRQLNQLVKTLVLASTYSVFSTNNSEALKKHKSKLEAIGLRNVDNFTADDLNNFTKKSESYAKDIVKETKKFFESTVKDNHGASLKYILKLLIPVGIDVPNDLNLLNSLQKMAKYRGSFAHSQGNLIQVMSASDMLSYIMDVIKLCMKIDSSVSEFGTYARP